MSDKPDIVKRLREEEKLGRLHGQSQGAHDELEIPKDLLEDMSDENVEGFKENVENREFNIEPMQYSSLSGDESVDEKELLFHGSSDMMLYFDTFGRVIKANKTAVVLSGYLEEEFIGKPFWKMSGSFTKQNLKTYLRTFKNTLRGKVTEHLVCELNEKSGKEHVIDFSSYPIKENGKVTRILLIGNDVTEQKETEGKYCLIAENTSDLITTATFTSNPIFTYISPSHKKAIGYEPCDLIGKPLFDFVHPDDKRKMLSLLKKYLSAKAKKFLTGKDSDASEKIEIRFRDKSGNWHYMETTANLIGNEIASVSRDVTDRKKAEEKLKEAHDILKAINTTLELKVNERTAEVTKLLERKNEIIHMIGHDLKNPLGPLLILLPMVERKVEDPKLKEMLQVSIRNVKSLKEMLFKTLEFAKQSELGMKVDFSNICLNENVSNLIESRQVLFTEINIDVENKIDEKIMVNADKLLLDEVFDNLFTNAVKYSQENSGTVTVDALEENDFVKVSVKDTGIGLTEEQLDHVFDKFYKNDDVKHIMDSHGLGLSICKHIVEKHGGKIWAESQGEGKGTTMFFTLPISSEKQEDKEQQ